MMYNSTYIGSNTSAMALGSIEGFLVPETDYEMEKVSSSEIMPPANDSFAHMPYPKDLRCPPAWEVVIKSLFYLMIIIPALVGNVLVIYIVWSNKCMRNTTNFYIVNLAVSDLMVTLSCTWVHLVDDLTEGWVLGAFFCKINSFSQVLSLVSSILTLTLISCDRFFGIVFAMRAHMTDRKSAGFLLLIWLTAIGISSPLLVYRKEERRVWLNHTEIWCADNWPSQEVYSSFAAGTFTNNMTAVAMALGNVTMAPATNVTHSNATAAAIFSFPVLTYPLRTAYYTIVSLVLYFVPVLIMGVAYSLIITKLRITRIPGERLKSEVKTQDKTRRKVIVMLVIILSVFALCWLPFQISILYSEHRSHRSELPHWFHRFQFFSNYLAFANSAFNPFIYAGFNESFKRGFKGILRCCQSGRQRRRTHYNAVSSGLRREDSFEFRSTSMETKFSTVENTKTHL